MPSIRPPEREWSIDAATLLDSRESLIYRLTIGTPLLGLLDDIVWEAERLLTGPRAAIMLVDPASGRLRFASGPSLPSALTTELDGIRIATSGVSIARAVRASEPVGVADVETDQAWARHAGALRTAGVRAVWTAPIRGHDGLPLAAFSLFFAEQREPDAVMYEVVELATSLAALAIERTTAAQKAGDRIALLDHSLDYVGLCDMRGRMLYLNPAGLDVIGMPPSDLLGATVADLYTAESSELFRDVAAPAALRDGTWTGHAQLRDQRTGVGIDVDVSVFLVRDPESGAPYRFGSIQRDARESRRTRLLESRLASIVQSAPDGILGIDPGGLITSWNPACERIFGYAAEEAIGRNVDMLASSELIHDQRNNLRRPLGGATVRDGTARRMRKNGDEVTISFTISPLYDGADVIGMVAFVRELGTREAAERERGVAETFQRGLLPSALPDVPGRRVTARYMPASGTLGGDWYDVLSLSDGRFAFVIGDVVGHDLDAAVKMMQLRNAVRVYALDGLAPADILRRLNVFALDAERNGAGSMFCTLAYAEYDPAKQMLRYSSAGHPPPLLLPVEGPATFLEAGHGMPVAVRPGTVYAETEVRLGPDDILLLYTDGLVESRTMPIDRGLEVLREISLAAKGSSAGLVERLVAGLDPGRPAIDDTAFLLITPNDG